jgi:starch-binding outer membrane protein, SusD/RagB family
MKNLLYIMSLALAFAMTSCSGFLDEPTPAQSLPSNTAFTTAQDIENGLIGAYNAVQASDLFGCNLVMASDIMADNGEWRGSFPSFVDMFNQALTADNAEVAGLWREGYRAINHANLVIKAVGDVEDPALTPEMANRLRGEALFIRGATHFEMVRYLGKPIGPNSASDPGIPIMTVAVASSDNVTFPSRNSVAEVYAQATSDLAEAASLLPETKRYGRASSFAAKAYLAEIAFQQGDYGTAATLAGEVMAGPFSLTASPVEFFVNEGSSEEIFVVVHTPQDNPGVNGSLATFHHINGRGGDVVVDGDLIANGYEQIITASQQAELTGSGYTAEDLRFTELTSSTNPPTVNVEKYEGYTNNDDDAPIWRLGEILLMRAEALARVNGVNQESLDLLNQIRTRAIRVYDSNGEVVAGGGDLISFDAADFATGNDLIEAIILERRVELAFEGNRFHDLVRLQRAVKGTPFDADRLRWPLPQRELDANANLTQNPGY